MSNFGWCRRHQIFTVFESTFPPNFVLTNSGFAFWRVPQFGYHECFKISILATFERILGPAEQMQENKGCVIDLGKVFLVKICERRSRFGNSTPSGVL